MVTVDPPNRPPLLQMRGIVKQFPGARALDGVDLDVLPGEVHCLLGQNGAGKSTLIKVLAGAHQPTEGEVLVDGEVVTIANPVAALKLGVATMYQELDVVGGLTVAENVFLGHELATAGVSRRREARRRTREILARLGHPEISPHREVGSLPAAAQQIVSMARALSHDARVIVMDEPSAVLDSDEVENLFRVVHQLTAAGVAIVYISHRMEEIRAIGDRITVLKDGRTVARDLPARDTPTRELIRLMTGRNVEYVFPPSQELAPDAPVVLDVQGLALRGAFTGVDLRVRAGEIVGLAGLVGSGRSEILEPVYRNITLSTFGRFSKGGLLDERTERRIAEEQAEALDLRPTGVDRAIRTLSGGNQQKAMLARWLVHGCRVLLLDEPTRGVDVGARAEIYALVRRLADEGAAVVVVSSEIPEVLGLSDRVLVVSEGRVVHEGPATAIDEHAVLDLVMEGSAA